MADDPRIISEKITARATEADPRAVSKSETTAPSATPPTAETLREEVGLRTAAPHDAPRAAQPSPAPQTAEKHIDADIAKILQEIKLPERHAPPTPPPPPGQAPALGVLPTMQHASTPAPEEKKIPGMVVPPRSAPPGVPETPRTLVPSAVSVPSAASEQPADGAQTSGDPQITSLHTMKTDLQDVVRSRKMSLVRAASMEQDRRVHQRVPVVQERSSGNGRKIALLLTAAVLLIALGGAAIYATYTLTIAGSSAQPIAPSILFAENQTTLPLDGQSPSTLKQTLAGILTQQGSVGSITRVIPTLAATDTQAVRPATLQEFFTALGVNAPPDLMRSLSDQFFLGIHMADVPSPVFIIPVVSYDRAFAAMLAWELSIDTSLAPLFRQVPAVVADGSGLPVARQFKDLVVRNYDVRGLADDSGAIVLYYSFPTPNLLIIAASPYTFPEVLSRLRAERKL